MAKLHNIHFMWKQVFKNIQKYNFNLTAGIAQSV
jgi:hypothetical protein